MTTKKNNDKKDLKFSAPVVFRKSDNKIEAAADDGSEKKKLPTFDIRAYSGDAISQWWGRVVVDLSGMKVSEKARPILLEHRRTVRLGHSTDIKIGKDELNLSGIMSGTSKEAKDVIADSENGFPFQASIGSVIDSIEEFKEGTEVEVNGRKFTGPISIARQSELLEVSFVSLGADDDTSATIAASRAAQQEGDGEMSKPKVKQVDASDDQTVIDVPEQTQEPIVDGTDDVQAARERMSVEFKRQADLEEVCKGDKSVLAQAISEGWSKEKTELHMYRSNQPQGLSFVKGEKPAVGREILEAAVALSCGIPETEMDAKHLQMASEEFGHRGISLKELLLECARQNGYRGRFGGDVRGVLKAAFSTRDIATILDNTMNMQSNIAFNAVESAWRDLAAIRSVNDFKTNTDLALTGDYEFKEVAGDGEIKHGDIGEESYTYDVDTYARMVAITRQDIINDNIGVLNQLSGKIGRGAALALNKLFWSTFMDNSTFFAAGNSNYIANYPLSVGNLETLEQTFMNQTDPDGDPLGVDPAILLVPNALYRTALGIMESTTVLYGGTTKTPAKNTFNGNFKVVKSSYLSNSSYTGYSALAHYLLASPQDLPVIFLAFLNGKQTPTVEQSDVDFNQLGIQIRGYQDFGAALGEYRAGCKSKGEA